MGAAVTKDWLAVVADLNGTDLTLVTRTIRLSSLLEDALNARLRPLKLTRAEFHVLTTLRTLAPPHECQPSDLANRLLLTSGGISNVLRRLRTRGLLQQDPDTRDRRSSWVRLSSTGIELADQGLSAWSEAQAEFFTAVPEDLRTAASAALGDLLKHIDDWEERPPKLREHA